MLGTLVGSVLAFWLFRVMYIGCRKRYLDIDLNVPMLQTVKWPMHASHRGGGSPFMPENTLPAYRKARNEYGTKMIEIDVRMAADGGLYLMHDGHLERTTDGVGPASSKTVEELKALDAGFHAYQITEEGQMSCRGQGYQVPLLQEVLDEFADDDEITFFFDIKDERVIVPVLTMLNDSGLEDRVILGAVSKSINKRLRALKPPHMAITADAMTIMTMVGLYWIGLLWILPVKHHFVGGIMYARGRRIITKKMVKYWHEQRGQKAIVFGSTLDTRAGCQECINCGVDVIMTDRPDVLRKVLDGNDYEQTALD